MSQGWNKPVISDAGVSESMKIKKVQVLEFCVHVLVAAKNNLGILIFFVSEIILSFGWI